MLRLDRRQMRIALITAITAALIRIGPSMAQDGGAVNLTSPANGTMIDGKFTIQGTATHSNLRYYKVEYASVGNPWMLVDGRLTTIRLTGVSWLPGILPPFLMATTSYGSAWWTIRTPLSRLKLV